MNYEEEEEFNEFDLNEEDTPEDIVSDEDLIVDDDLAEEGFEEDFAEDEEEAEDFAGIDGSEY